MPHSDGVEISQITGSHDDSSHAPLPPLAACKRPIRFKTSLGTKKWFKLAARRCADNTFWCPKDECVKNQSDLMLAAALVEEDKLYWETDELKPPSTKRKCPQAEEESLDDSVSMVKTAMSAKKGHKSALKLQNPRTRPRFKLASRMTHKP